MYQRFMGRCLEKVFTGKLFSQGYGLLQNLSLSKRNITPFIKNFNINIGEFLPEEGRDERDPYSSFNQFFIRRFREGKRIFVKDNHLAAFSEGRYLGHTSVNNDTEIPVKGEFLRPKDLLQHSQWNQVFKYGPMLIARLCPVDYHRFHFPDEGKIIDYYPIQGKLHSVNPIALKRYGDIFSTNERIVTILDSRHFGKLAYIEVGAICVGRIVQSMSSTYFKRGEEKGYFLFGASTIILMGIPGRWQPSKDILDKTKKGIETYIRLGDQVGKKVGF